MRDAGTIVHCKNLKKGDIVRRPVPGAELLEVLAVNRVTRELEVQELAGEGTQRQEVFTMRYGNGHIWMYLSSPVEEHSLVVNA